MWGTFFNVAAIVIGGIAGLTTKRQIPPNLQAFLKLALGVWTVAVGLGLTWTSIHGSFTAVLKQFAILMLALIIGKIIGRLLHLQRKVNEFGRFAGQTFAQASSSVLPPEAFKSCVVLFCLAPLAILGPIQEGLYGNWKALVIKGVMDGLAAMGFIVVFRGSLFLALIPLIAWQGTLTILAAASVPFLHRHGLLDAVGATLGLLIFCVSLVIFELKKIQISDYFPSLFIAPLFTWLTN